jgi:hypothetical protein
VSLFVPSDESVNSALKGPEARIRSAAAGAVVVASQLVFTNEIQPLVQFVPASQRGGVFASKLLHIVAHVLRLIASLRALRRLDVKSLLIDAVRLRSRISLKEGAAKDARIANTEIVTINSISVKPRAIQYGEGLTRFLARASGAGI